jgi:hypothetical protein
MRVPSLELRVESYECSSFMSEASQRFLPTLNPNSLRYLVPRHDKTKRLSKYIEHLSFQNFNIFQRLFFAINKTVTTIMKASEKAAPS